jgi:exosortase/archaeosortase family protein
MCRIHFSLYLLSFFFVSLVDADATFISESIWAGSATITLADRFTLAITPEFTGSVPMTLLFSGLLAFPASAHARFLGFLVGSLCIQFVCFFRVVSLVFVGEFLAPTHFLFISENVWPLVVYFLTLVFFVLWVSRVKRSDRAARAAKSESLLDE